MATLVLSQIGSALGGPAASIAGAFAGSAIDRGLLGSARSRGPRLDQLAVQGSGYGSTIPRIYGRMRVAGNIIWSTPVREFRAQSGRKSGAGGFGYSVSLAIALSATPIMAVGRVWADGKEVRSESGEFTVPVVMRVYTGSEAQGVDPLIEAAEGAGNAPAYRGLAHVVLEDLQLGEFAGRVPQLSFEVICQHDDLSVFDVVTDLASTVGLHVDGPSFRTGGAVGYAAGQQGGIESDLEALSLIEPFVIDGTAHCIELRFLNSMLEPLAVPHDDLLVAFQGTTAQPAESPKARQQKVARELSLIYAEPAREFEPCVQRAITANFVSVASRERRAAPFALSASLAKQVAERELTNARDSADRSVFALPLRYVAIGVGDYIRIDNAAQVFSILSSSIENASVALTLIRKKYMRNHNHTASFGRKISTKFSQQGPTGIRIADIPQLPTENLDQPRIMVAAFGQSEYWRQATIFISTDDGFTYSRLNTVSSSAITGITERALGTGPVGRWDKVNSVIINLHSESDFLESFSDSDIQRGRNIALVGTELIAFCRADHIEGRKYRISQFLRGLYGTDGARDQHAIGDEFILINKESLLPVNLPLQFWGSSIRIKGVGSSEPIESATYVSHKLSATNLIPLCPVHLRVRVDSSDAIHVSWNRRSRLGFTWLDGVDAPIGERMEAYEVQLSVAGFELKALVYQENLIISSEEQIKAFGELPSSIVVVVSQLSELVGSGVPASRIFQIR